MKYQVAERFKSVQGEGLYAGTPMAFIRFVGCSVGKKICQRCDTDFDRTYEHLGGGEYTLGELADWAKDFQHVCLTGGEPLNTNIAEFFDWHQKIHIETSGTIEAHIPERVFVCVSPKPGWREAMIARADEIKVIVPGLGTNESLIRLYDAGQLPPNGTYRWPSITDARFWARTKPVFVQPANGKFDVEMNNLGVCKELVLLYPELRLSVQLHKLLRVR